MTSLGRNVSVENYCRLCGVETNDGVVIYSDKGVSLCLEEKIIRCLRINVSQDDQLPKKVCGKCYSCLESCYQFAEQANKVQHTLGLLICMKQLYVLNEVRNETNSTSNQRQIEGETILVKREPHNNRLHVTLQSDTVDQDDFSTESSPQKTVAITSVASTEKSDKNQIPDRQCQRKPKEVNPKSTVKKISRFSHWGKKNDIISQQQAVGQKENPDDSHAQSDLRDEIMQDEGKEREEVEVGNFESEHGKYKDNPSPETAERVQDDWKTYWGIKCNQCGELFPSKPEFDIHYRTTYYKEPEYTCCYCNKVILKYPTFRTHHHRHLTEGRYRCEHCQKGFSLKSILDRHTIAKHTGVKPFLCEECGKGYVTKLGLIIHLQKHGNDKRLGFQCDVCGKMCEHCEKGFSLKSILDRHTIAKHTGVKPFLCEECGKGYVTKTGLIIHLQKHGNDKRLGFQCYVCGKILHTRWSLSSHKWIHKLGRHFMCDVCGKTFTMKGNMLQHFKHHTKERPHACDKCGKRFAEKSHLIRHGRLHSESRPFQCKVCMKKFKTERYLRNHAMIHSATRPRPHVCTFCNKRFLRIQELKQHYNIHTGERPYVCKFCERSFTNYPNYLKHMRRRHKVEPQNLKSLEKQVSGD